ncbi:MAG: SCO family protein, partial [Bacteroidota bacterium]|nr:SCO family protein [Bacteroidota bacterium]
SFNLVDQHGLEVSENVIENKVVVVDFFFVSCGSICPIMTKNLKRVHDFYKKNHNVLILSHTVWPEMDSVSVLNNYANEHDANYETWRFLTGEKKELYRLARKDYMVVPAINDPNYQHGSEADFIHTENVVLIDKKKRIRGYYDGTDENAMKKLVSDIGKLL